MLPSLVRKITKLPLWINAVGLVTSFVAFNWVKNRLDISYAASNYPEDYATGQTSFNGETIKEYYKHMTDAGTLDVYWQTQIIDFGFMLALFCLGLFAGALLSRIARPDSWGRRFGIWAGVMVMIGTLFDLIENLTSFIMLSSPADFSNWLALPYSSFAVAKFAFIVLGMLGFTITLVLVLGGRLFGRPSIG